VAAPVAAAVALGGLLPACARVPGRSAPLTTRPPASAATAAATTGTTGTTATTMPALPVPAPVRWSACGSLQCASVTVPLDYGEPQMGTIQIAVARHPALDPAQRIGSIVINPGGPGGSGIDDLPDELSILTPELLDRFDIVSFDPRGVQRSSPVSCNPPGQAPQAPSTPGPLADPIPTTAAAQQALITNDQEYAAQCEAQSGSILPFVGTVDTARDLDEIRQAIGDAKLTFIGHSYGTLLGATYAAMFPTHVRAMVLDGAIDPALSAQQMIIDQAQGFEAVLDSFFSWCATSGCAWHGGSDPSGALLALIAQSRASRLPAAGGRSAGPGEFYEAILSALYSQSSWPSLADALAEAAAGNGNALVAMSTGYLTGGSSNAAAAETAIDCLDHPAPRDLDAYPVLAAVAAAKAPLFGPLLAWGLVGCAVWPVPPTRTPAASDAPGSPPIIVTGATGDPATPYQWAVNLAGELPQGILVTWQGENHVAYYYSACVRAIDQAYLVQGTLPAPHTVCTD